VPGGSHPPLANIPRGSREPVGDRRSPKAGGYLMSHTCTKCSRVNPDEAIYCYFDGIPLNGLGQSRGPVAVGAQAFPSPFVFPSGRTCRSFDELAIACQEEWAAARDLLRQGF